MVSNEMMYNISKYGILTMEEAEYYINSIKTAAEIVKLAGVEDKNDTMKSVVFEKIASNIFWLKEEPNRLDGVFGKENINNETVPEDETTVRNNDEHDETNNELSPVYENDMPEEFDGDTIHPDDLIGEKIKIYGIITNNETGEGLIHTDRGIVRTFSNILIKSITKGDVGRIETRVSSMGRKYYTWISELKQHNDMIGNEIR